MEMRGRWKIDSGSSPITRFSTSSVKQSPSPSSGVGTELNSIHTKTFLCFACHVMNKHDGLQALSGLVTDDESGVQPFLPLRNDPSAQCTPVRLTVEKKSLPGFET